MKPKPNRSKIKSRPVLTINANRNRADVHTRFRRPRINNIDMQHINQVQQNMNRIVITDPTDLPQNVHPSSKYNIIILDNFQTHKHLFGKPLVVTAQQINNRKIGWHVDNHGDVVACVPNSNNMSTECLIKDSRGNLKTIKYKLKYPQALVFKSSYTHRPPSNRNPKTKVAFHALNKIPNKLPNGVRTLRNLVN